MRKLPTLTNIDQPELDALTELSILTGASRAALIRRAIKQFIDTQGKQITSAHRSPANTTEGSL